MDFIFKIITCLSFVTIISCSRSTLGPEPHNIGRRSYIPGECLASSSLSVNSKITDTYCKMNFCLSLIGWGATTDGDGFIETRPQEFIFAKFLPNASEVKKLFHEYAYPATFRSDAFYDLTSIYYDSCISLVADKDFAGYKAGDNIMQEATLANDNVRTLLSDGLTCIEGLITEDRYSVMPILPDLPFSYQGIFGYDSFYVYIPNRDYEIVDEDVTFTFTMPVKVGLYLTWLNDTLTDPDAPFPYREETLTCTFSINKGLH